ncbi:SDR family NAD(P)-dependent oxidoreductase [Streptomonospora nanhaiensis]|uniref:Ketoreductase domain-containing protein n=1 Tax=Streptomonospora nanhaiensis TaxID=1323731 RepID=A0A853BNP2_9ACTN|nr:hypothetical protein [Streptomonospora nanhaiensis]
MSQSEHTGRNAAEAADGGGRHRRTALVTGASSGIGEEFARRLAERGYDLVLVARRAERVEALAAELAERFAVGAEALPADLADPGGLARVEDRLRADGSGAAAPVDLLVNNAGHGGGGEFARQDVEEVDALLALNVRAQLRLARAVLPVQLARREAGAGRVPPLGVINVSSMAGQLTAAPGSSVYAASKAFLTSWSQSVALEVAPHGVHVTAVLPGFVRTDMTQSLQDSGRLPEPAFVPKDRVVLEALRGWAAGWAVVVPGPVYGAADRLLRLVPRGLYRALARRSGARKVLRELD